MQHAAIVEKLRATARDYIPEQVARQTSDAEKVSFQIGLALSARPGVELKDLEVMDLGGGPGIFSVGCSALGMRRSVVVDDFQDVSTKGFGQSILDIHKKYGTEIYSQDMVARGIDNIPGQFDVITCFDSMEHLHNSPKRLFQQAVQKLKPNGAFILSGPNCVSLRKRVTVPFGFGSWSRMDDWYEADQFRGHVREPDVASMHHIARDLKLARHHVLGRNFMVLTRLGLNGALASKLDPIRFFPSLCSDLYLIGYKPG